MVKFSKNFRFEKFDFWKILRFFFTKIDIFRNCRKNRNFDQNRDISKICPKSKFFGNVTKIDNFRNFRKNRNFSKTLTKIELFRNFDQNQKFSKFSNVSEKNVIFRKFLPKSKFWENLNKIESFLQFEKNQNFSKILTKIELFWKFDQKQKFPKFSKKKFRKLWFCETYDSNRNFSKFAKYSNCLKKLTKIKICEFFYKNWNFSKIAKKIEFHLNFDAKSRFFENLSKIEIFQKLH